MLDQIVAVKAEPGYHLKLTYDDGESVNADFRSVISQGCVFSPLAYPDFFASVALDAYGRAVIWPGELEFCADALRLEWGAPEQHQSPPATNVIENIVLVEDL